MTAQLVVVNRIVNFIAVCVEKKNECPVFIYFLLDDVLCWEAKS